MNVFISLDDDNYTQGWGSTRGNDRDLEIDLPEDHDFFKSIVTMQSYKVENGVLVKDIHREAELIAKRLEERNKPSDKELLQTLKAENERLSTTVDSLTSFMLMSGL